jgi:hypothetical protein
MPSRPSTSTPNLALSVPLTSSLPIAERSLEEVMVARLQTQSLLSTYARAQPPLEMLDLERNRAEEEKKLAARVKRYGSGKKYPGVSDAMVRSMSAGVARFGGAQVAKDRSQKLPRDAKDGRKKDRDADTMFLETFIRPMTTGQRTGGSVGTGVGAGSEAFDMGMGLGMGSTGSPVVDFPDAPSVRQDPTKPDFSSTKSVTLTAARAAQAAVPDPDLEEADMTPAQLQAKLVATLTKQCNDLAWRVVAMEEELKAARRAQQLEPRAGVRKQEEAQMKLGLRPGTDMWGLKWWGAGMGMGAVAEETTEEGVKGPTHPKLLPIEKTANNISGLIVDLTKSL